MNTFFIYIGWALMLIGAFFLLTASVGLWRMPDFFSRIHPAGVGDSMGITLLLLGIVFIMPFGITSLKVVLLAALALYTSATACHALAHGALTSGVKPKGKIINRKKK